jgi:hypothetical protein
VADGLQWLIELVRTKTKVLAFGLTFLAGVGLGVGAYRIHLIDRAHAEAKTYWMICTMAHQDVLLERAKAYREKVGRWPTNVQEMVEARLLPEWSEVHFCPAAAGWSALARKEYQGRALVEDNETGLVAHFGSSPYRFVLENGKFGVRCDYEKRHNR